MSRPKQKNPLEICADCGASEPGWASVNFGLLICDDCCSIHRTLGRHISQIKSIKRNLWPQTQLQMVKELSTSGSNTILEHTLVDSANVGFAAAITNSIKNIKNIKKPTAKDPLHPTKADFIRLKYQNLAFINRSNAGEESQTDLNEQLHSSVRTPNLKTSLRLLLCGADPNYLHPDKGNTPLIMATKAGLIFQVELLLIYGADPLISDAKGKTPLDYALPGNKPDIIKRLLESQYELTDRLSYFLCGRKPDHCSSLEADISQHFLIPELSEAIDNGEAAKEAKQKLLSLPNKLFQEIAKDVYDEVDRREVEDVWLMLRGSNTTSDRSQSVPFLPVNPAYSSIRNQGRQKLARYNSKEFATLVFNVLCESKRRQLGLPSVSEVLHPSSSSTSSQSPRKSPFSSMRGHSNPQIVDENESDSERSYDSVASEEECDSEAALQRLKLKYKMKATGVLNGKHEVVPKMLFLREDPSRVKYEFLESQLAKSDVLIQELVLSNKDMHGEITRLQVMVQKLIDENAQLRAVVVPKASELQTVDKPPSGPPPAILPRAPKPSCSSISLSSSSSRPQSMVERSHLHPNTRIPPISTPTHQVGLPRDDSGIESNSCSSHLSNEGKNPDLETVPESNLYVLPRKEDVILKTEQITRRIQELLHVALESKIERYASCSDNILFVVNDMVDLFPKQIRTEAHSSIFNALHQLQNSALALQSQCGPTGKGKLNVDSKQLTQQVIQCAYDVAKGAKQLVTMFTHSYV